MIILSPKPKPKRRMWRVIAVTAIVVALGGAWANWTVPALPSLMATRAAPEVLAPPARVVATESCAAPVSNDGCYAITICPGGG